MTPSSDPGEFLVIRLAAGSVDEIKSLASSSSSTSPFSITISCKQVPGSAKEGDPCIIWLGSDNNKGVPTQWKQGFKAIGTVKEIIRHGAWKDATDLTLSIEKVFDVTLGKTDIVKEAGDQYQFLVDFPIIGINNYNSQVVQVVDQRSSAQNLEVFASIINKYDSGYMLSLLDSHQIDLSKINTSVGSKADGSAASTGYLLNKHPDFPFNVIYFGPPGTGKTYTAINILRDNFEEHGNKYWDIITFHPSYSYEDFIEGIRPEIGGEHAGLSYKISDGFFYKICNKAREVERPFALLIDEINRGQISSIFGEIITLIEPSNREISKGTGIEVTLPYSGRKFSVPGNLHIIGTMNSADRSIALIDIALRRRFEFKRVDPDYSILSEILTVKNGSENIDGINIPILLNNLNQRIAYLSGQDFVIGHSYFLNIFNFESLCIVFETKIIPLLQEYYYDDWGKICYVLGEDYKSSKETDFVKKSEIPTSYYGDEELKEVHFIYKPCRCDEMTKEMFLKISSA